MEQIISNKTYLDYKLLTSLNLENFILQHFISNLAFLDYYIEFLILLKATSKIQVNPT